MMKFRSRGRTVLTTEGDLGTGLAVALEVARHGMKVAIANPHGDAVPSVLEPPGELDGCGVHGGER